jgi:hypothetical protein
MGLLTNRKRASCSRSLIEGLVGDPEAPPPQADEPITAATSVGVELSRLKM